MVETMPLMIDNQDGQLIERHDPIGKSLRVAAVQATAFQSFWLDQVTRT